jgi:Lar family restriction alleviation protein
MPMPEKVSRNRAILHQLSTGETIRAVAKLHGISPAAVQKISVRPQRRYVGMKPCPFCGSDDLDLLCDKYNVMCISCSNCGTKGPEADSTKDAQQLWDDRKGGE